VAEIQRKILERGKRNALSRLFHARNDKETIASWRLDLNRILLIFNVRSVTPGWPSLSVRSQTELAVSTHVNVSDVGRDAANTRTVVSDIRDDVINTQTVVTDVHRDVVSAHAIVSELQAILRTPAPLLPTFIVIWYEFEKGLTVNNHR